MTIADPGTASPIHVERWPTELPLLIFVILASAFVWFLLALTIVGLVYVVLIGLALFFAHVMTIAYIRGSAVRLGPDQFPELYQRVVELSRRAGIRRVPEAYLMEAGGSLNAFATRFFRSRFVVLFSDLLDACGDNKKARDMVIGHELGHIRAGHLNYAWLLAPGLLMPFLGAAYSRAREYTCDRYGAALCGDRAGATAGLAILAAGGSHGPRVNLGSFVAQSGSLDTGWMTLGKWLSGYPPLCDRVAALEPDLKGEAPVSLRGPVRAILILGSFWVVPILGLGIFAALLQPALESALELPELESELSRPVLDGDVDAALVQIEDDFERLGGFILELRAERGGGELTGDEIYEAWRTAFPDEAAPLDPFDGLGYGYYEEDDGFVLWSIGPDREVNTEDDPTKRFAYLSELTS